jgi:hypothetical protein
MEYTITLTTAENLALGAMALSQQDWIDNAVHERCRIAIDEIVAICVETCLKDGIQIPSSKEEMVKLAFEKKWVKSIYEQQTEVSSGSLQG